MHEQIGWRGMVERLKNEAPRYAQLLPELPRLVHQALQRDASPDRQLLAAILQEQRRGNRLLLALAAAVGGFAAGAMLVLALLRWHA